MDDHAPAAPENTETLEAPAPVRSTAPPVPWGFELRQFGVDYTPLPDGGMLLTMTIGMRHPQLGPIPMAPNFTFRFGPNDWEKFQREVAAGGVKSKVATSRILPAGPIPR